MSTLLDRTEPAAPTDEESRLAADSGRRLVTALAGRDRLTVRVAGDEGPDEVLVLPASAVRMLSEILAEMARGKAVTVVPIPSELTIEQAADFLNVSRPFLIGMLDRGEIPSSGNGWQRKVPLRELADFKRRNVAARRETLRELADLSQELGLY